MRQENIFIKKLEDIHKEKFPNELKRIRYTDKNRSKAGEIDYIPLDDKIPADAELAYSTTFHVCQGMTINAEEDVKIWICRDRLNGWADNAVYMALTRAEGIDQVRQFEIQYEREVKIVQGTMTEIISRKIQRYQNNDAARHRAFDLDTEYIADLCQKSAGECPICHEKIMFENYQQMDNKQFSVDRLDNTKGHLKGNVRITCFACNTHRRN